MINVIVCGAAGRMGMRLISLVAGAEDLKLVGATERTGHDAIGRDAGTVAGAGELDVPVVEDLRSVVDRCDAVINFTAPEGTMDAAAIVGAAGKAMVVGTTGMSPEQLTRFKENVALIACVFAPNFSVGVALLLTLVEEAARRLGEGYDIEVIESHHHFKKDAPSGTALALARAAAAGRSWDLDFVGTYGREGMVGERPGEEIGIHAIRAGDIVGEHTVLFGGIGEQVQLVHRAQSRDTFAVGALRAVRFAVNARAGLYDMRDVLGLK